MITLARNAAAAVALGDAIAHTCTGGLACLYASGTFSTAVLHFSPSKTLPFVPVATLNAAGASQVFLGRGFVKLVLTGSVSGANATVS